MWNWFKTEHAQYIRNNNPEYLKYSYQRKLVIT